jgi:hypothetical protein
MKKSRFDQLNSASTTIFSTIWPKQVKVVILIRKKLIWLSRNSRLGLKMINIPIKKEAQIRLPLLTLRPSNQEF